MEVILSKSYFYPSINLLSLVCRPTTVLVQLHLQSNEKMLIWKELIEETTLKFRLFLRDNKIISLFRMYLKL